MPFQNDLKTLNRPAWDLEKVKDDELWEDEDPPVQQRKDRPLRPDAPDPAWMVKARWRLEKEQGSAPGAAPGSAHATIRPGQFARHHGYAYAVWLHRLAGAVAAELGRLPQTVPPLPWPIHQKPINELRMYIGRSGGAGGWGPGKS